ncbi:MAG: hypothetical protein Kow00106_17040 [Anaerolineae bacterium]
MSKQSWLGAAALLVAALAIVGFGVWTTYAQGPRGYDDPCAYYGPGMMPGAMMGGWGSDDCSAAGGMWYGGMMGMMGGWGGAAGCPFAGMMMSYGNAGFGMMGGWNPPADLAPAGDTLTLDEALAVAQAYVAAWDDPNLRVSEVMQFDNHFYGEAVETDSGRGAFEFLIDPVSGAVILEPGPNMMWNLKYGMHVGWGQPHTRWNTPHATDGAEMSVSAEDARAAAQAYLDANYPGLTVAEEAEAFYGYYTLHILEDGQIVGMLSVNGSTGAVWLHHWHGEFVAMTEVE